MQTSKVLRIVLACMAFSIVVVAPPASAWSGDEPTTPPTTVFGTAEECKTAQNGLKEDFDKYIEELQAPDPEYQKVQEAIDAHRERMEARKLFKKAHEDAMKEEADLDRKANEAFKAKIGATYRLIDNLCATDAATVLILERTYFQTYTESLEQTVNYLAWLKKNWRTFQFTLPRSGKVMYQKWTRGLKKLTAMADEYKELTKSIEKETPGSLFSSPVIYPISAR